MIINLPKFYLIKKVKLFSCELLKSFQQIERFQTINAQKHVLIKILHTRLKISISKGIESYNMKLT